MTASSYPSFRLPLALLFLLTGFADTCRAVITIHFNGGPGERCFYGRDALPSPDGTYVFLGTFPTAPLTFSAMRADSVMSGFLTFGMLEVRTIHGQVGSVAGSLSGDEAQFAGQPVYAWVLRTSDRAMPLATFENVVEAGLFSSSNSSWVFPVDASTPSPLLSTSEVDLAWQGAITGNALVLDIIPIPEPSSGAMLAAVAFACLRRRRAVINPRSISPIA